MARNPLFAGLEIGTSKICFVIAEARHDGSLRILGNGEAPSRGVRKGEIIDFDQVRQCVFDAKRLAEDRADVEIESVYLSLTGSHISSMNHRGCIRIPDGQDVISQEDVEEIKIIARDVNIPSENAFLHTLVRRYYVDGQEGVDDPVGRYGHQLEADYHIVHGVKKRMQNAIRFVQEIPLEVEEVVFAPLAAAQVMVDEKDKEDGALVIDTGGGTTDYLLYERGSVCQSGSLGVGGDHILNDIAMVMRVPFQLAEQIKLAHGSAVVRAQPGETVLFEGDSRLHAQEIDLEELQMIVASRVEETFQTLKCLLVRSGYLNRVGAGIFLAGGGSLLPGMEEALESVFGLPVKKGIQTRVSGVASLAEDPRYTTAIGLVRYAQRQKAVRPTGSLMRRVGAAITDLFGVTR